MKLAVFGIITEADILKILKLSKEALPEIVADKTQSYKSDSALHPQYASVLTSQCFQSLHHCCFLLTTCTLRQYHNVNILTTTVFPKVLCQNNQRVGSQFKKETTLHTAYWVSGLQCYHQVTTKCSPLWFMAQVQSVQAINRRGKKRGSITYITDWENKVGGYLLFIFLLCLIGSETNYIHMEWLQIPEAHQKQNKPILNR